MNKPILILFFTAVLSINVFCQSEGCDCIKRIGEDKPVGNYLTYIPSPFSPSTNDIKFGVPDTSSILLDISDVYGVSYFDFKGKLAGGNYSFDYKFLLSRDTKSGEYFFKIISDLDRTFKSTEMHFEGSKKILIVK